jgi:hypothetical protein
VSKRRKKNTSDESTEQLKNSLEASTTLFIGQILALRELAGIVTSHVLPLDDPPILQAVSAFAAALDLRRKSNTDAHQVSSDADSRQDEEESAPLDIELDPEGRGIVLKHLSTEAAEALSALLRESRKRFEIAARAPLMRRSLLAMAVSSFEALVGNLIEENLRRHNSALGSAEKEFSLDDLLRFSNLQEAVEDLVSRRVEDFTRWSVREWQRWFERNMAIQFGDLVPDWEHVQEIFERRNLVMHSDCRVTRQYISQVSPHLTINVKRGDQLEIEDDYLDTALDEVLTLGLLLGFRVWIKLIKKETQKAAEWLLHHQTELMEEQRWLPVMMMSRAVIGLPIKEITALDFKVNGWHSEKVLHGLDAIREEVKAWDASALTTRYRLARSLLLGENESATELLKRYLNESGLDYGLLIHWPLLEQFRNDGVIEELTGLRLDDPSRK